MKLVLVHPLLAEHGCASRIPGLSPPGVLSGHLVRGGNSWSWLKMAAGTLLLFFLVTSLGIFIPVTSPLVVSWGFLILMQGLPHYTRPGSLQWEQEEKRVI